LNPENTAIVEIVRHSENIEQVTTITRWQITIISGEDKTARRKPEDNKRQIQSQMCPSEYSPKQRFKATPCA